MQKYKKKMLLLLGESGAGKTTIADALADRYGFKVLPSYTTRSKRRHSDKDHIYITQKEYNQLENKVATNINNQTGDCYCAISAQIEENDIYVIDCQGIKELKCKYKGNKEFVVVHISVPEHIRIQRMMQRGDSSGAIKIRNLHDQIEFASVSSLSDYTIECLELDECISKIHKIWME